MTVEIINPANGLPLSRDGEHLVDGKGNSFPVLNGIPRICEPSNYTENFGKQWNMFRGTQIDRPEADQQQSEVRFFSETGWTPDDLAGLDILEVGSGAGRFSRVVLERTQARLWSVDYSSAVEANLANNRLIDPERLRLFQASIYELPFPDESFDKVFCLGVLQHTPDFDASVGALVRKAKRGAEIVVDFYPVRGFWTKINAKYLLRPFTKRMSHEKLLKRIDANVDWMMKAARLLRGVRLGALTRFLPMVDEPAAVPSGLSKEQHREWVVLDTFDMFSPEYDNPQRISRVAGMFRRHGATVTHADFIQVGGASAAVVRAIRN